MNLAKRARLVTFAAAMTFGAMTLSAGAQEVSDSHLSAARAAIDAIEATDDFDSVLPQAAQELKARLIQQNPNLEELIDTTVSEKALELASRRADLEDEAALAYARVFSEQELDEIAQFYNSPAGQKLLSDGPIVTREVIRAAEIWRRGITRDLTNGVTEQLQGAIDVQAPEGDGGATAQ